MNKLVLYHGSNCADGITAAWAVWRALGDNAEYRAVSYGEEPPDVAGRDVVIVDFSYPRETLLTMTEAAHSIFLLDHHKSAQADLVGLPSISPLTYGEWRASFPAEKLAVVFDMERSGAGLAWDFFHDAPRPRIIDLVEDRDLWRFRHKDSKPFHAWLASQDFREELKGVPQVFHMLRVTEVSKPSLGDFINEGHAILRAREQTVANIVRSTLVMGSSTWFSPRFGGTGDVPTCNAPGEFASDVGAVLIAAHPSAPFVAAWFDSAHGRHWSLRSGPDGTDVSEVARHNGGGGHEHAAGFKEEKR